ncbi:MAG: protein-export chaperone SecB [Alphaproteobacteria bacterium]|nr:MAG: protein-export chaperone SecB [Alphaproteobacteria bacterium]
MTQPSEDFPLVIHAQYVKDLSFENPNAPGVLAQLADSPPQVNVNIDVDVRHVHERTYEVVLSLRAGATVADKPAFLIELAYGGLAAVGQQVPEDRMEPLLYVEMSRHLFPFARAALADLTRDGGFPPLLINPIDFEQFYRRHKVGALRAAGSDAPAAETAAPEAATDAAAADGQGGA